MTLLHPTNLHRQFHDPKFYDMWAFRSFQMTPVDDRYIRYESRSWAHVRSLFCADTGKKSGTFENFPHLHQNISSNYLKYLQTKVFHLHLYQDTKNSFMVHKLSIDFKSAPLIGWENNRISINLYLLQYFYLENIWNIKIFERWSSPCSSNIKKIAKSKAICLVAIVYCE